MPTLRVRICVFGGAPGIAALIVTGNVPSGVLDTVEMLKLTDTGFPFLARLKLRAETYKPLQRVNSNMKARLSR